MTSKKATLLILPTALFLLLPAGCGESLPPPPAPGDTSNMTEEEIAEQDAFQKKMADNIEKAESKKKGAKSKN